MVVLIEAIELADSFSNTAQLHDVDLLSLRDESPFNFSALNNRARRYCSGNFLLFLNNDTRFESSDPLKQLLALALK